MNLPRARRLGLYGAAAAATAIVAVSGPFDARSDASFAWHMAQHLLLLFAVPFFALLAHPLEWFGPPRASWRVALVRAARSAPVRALSSPACCLLIFIAVLWGSHFTPLYEASLEHPLVHVFEHTLYVIAGTAFWLPILAPPPFASAPYPVRALYCFLALPQGALLAVALLAARTPLYARYAGPNALLDQHDAAAVMWVGGGGIVLAALLVTIGRWAAREQVEAGSAEFERKEGCDGAADYRNTALSGRRPDGRDGTVRSLFRDTGCDDSVLLEGTGHRP